MSDAIRDVTIRVRIEQVESRLQAPDFSAWLSGLAEIKAAQMDIGQQSATMFTSSGTFAEQAAGFTSIADAAKAAVDPFENLDAAVSRLRGELQGQSASFELVEQAATRNFDALLNQAQAESISEQATRQATIAQKAQSVEMINGAGNALRSAAASSTVSGVVSSLGQAFLFAARGAAQQSAGNVAVATTATAAGTASEFQAVAIGHVSAAGARAATSNAALAASNAAAGASARGAAGMMAGMASALPQVAIGVAVVSLAVELGSRAWEAYGESSKSASDKIKESVKQRLEAEKQSAAIEAALALERLKRQDAAIAGIERQQAAAERFRSFQDRLRNDRSNFFDQAMSLNGGDLNTQLDLANKRRKAIASDEDGAVRGAGQGRYLNFRFGNGKGEISPDELAAKAKQAQQLSFSNLNGTDLATAEKERFDFLEAIKNKQREIVESEKVREGVLRQQLQLEQQSQQALKGRLATIQEMIAAEQGRLTSAAERFAQMDPGEQARLKEVSLKAKNGGELSLQEAQLLSQSGIGQGQASQAFQRIADKAGFKDVAGNLGEYDQIQHLRFQGKGVSEALERVNQDAIKKNEEIVKSMKTIETVLDVVQTIGNETRRIESRVDALQRMFLDSKSKNRDTSIVGLPLGNRSGT